MSAKQDITELLNHAGVAYDVADVDYLAAIFAENGTFRMVIAGGDEIRFEGRETVRNLYADSLASQNDQRRHVVTNIYFNECSDSRAVVVSYLVLIAVAEGKLNVLSSGMYTDTLVNDGSGWLIQDRHLALDLPY
jgi:SnoaL-like domain